MTDWNSVTNLLVELEHRQDEVLKRLDELNDRIELTLGQWLNPHRERTVAAEG